MPNSFLSMKRIAREALPILVDNLVMPNLIYQDYSDDFASVGDTIQVKKPAIFTAKDFNSSTGVETQDVTLGKVDVTMDKLADVSVEVSSKELALEVEDFVGKVIQPAASALAEKINREGLELYKNIPYYAGTSGTTPDSLADFAGIRKILNNNKVPMGMRRAVWDVDADASFTQLDALVNVDKSGDAQALREAQIGRVYGLDNYYSQAVATHTAGGYTALDDVTVTATKGDTNITMSSTAGASTADILEGDIFELDGYKYVVTADATAVNGDVSVNIYPAIQEDVTDEAVTFADQTARGHVANLGFHRNAFGFVTRSLPLPSDKEAYTVSYNGITLRVVYGYDMKYKKNMLSLDVLYGFETLYPELAVRYLG